MLRRCIPIHIQFMFYVIEWKFGLIDRSIASLLMEKANAEFAAENASIYSGGTSTVLMKEYAAEERAAAERDENNKERE